jgi:hypothetical protein
MDCNPGLGGIHPNHHDKYHFPVYDLHHTFSVLKRTICPSGSKLYLLPQIFLAAPGIHGTLKNLSIYFQFKLVQKPPTFQISDAGTNMVQ